MIRVGLQPIQLNFSFRRRIVKQGRTTNAWLGVFLVLVILMSAANRVSAQDRYDRDQDRYDRGQDRDRDWDRDRDDRHRRSGACFYREANFTGEKFCVRAGERMAQVPPEFNDRISSVRMFGRVEITVYQNRDFREPMLRLRDDVANLQSYQVSPGHSWNDRVSSIEVSRDRDRGDRGDYDRDGACFFKESDFRGEKFCVQRGDRLGQVPPGFGDRISSVRLYGRVTVTIYQDENFRGSNLRLQDDVSNLQSYQVAPGHSWNDRVSSIRVY
jgi:hypothetical protein